jgi:hypothetical protein
MEQLNSEPRLAETDAFVRQFLAERAAWWDAHGRGDLDENSPIEPWTDPDHPDDRLGAAYRSGIVPPARRERRPFGEDKP